MASCYRFGRFVLRPECRALSREGIVLRVGSRAYEVLLALVQRRHRVVSKSELLDLAWPDAVVGENSLEVQVSTLRRALGAEALVTVPRRGYRFGLPVRETGDDEPTPIARPAIAVPLREARGRAAGSAQRRQQLLRLRSFRLRVAASARRRA